jgi:betaine-aldehyde dehydrogenase
MDRTGADSRDQKMFVGGNWIDAIDGERLPVENPFDCSVVAYVPRARARDVDRSVAAAAAAFPGWRQVLPRERGRALIKIADAIEKEIERLARLLATETGNALRTQARPEIRGAIDIFRYFGGLGSELRGSTLPFGEDVLSYTRREPIGVVGGIIAWNAPVTLASVKIAPALCAGNTIVLKAAEDAPLTVLAIAEIAQNFLPAGVLNVLTGLGEEAGAALLNNPQVQKFSFTGSTEVGRLVLQAAAPRIVPTSLELGGKNLASSSRTLTRTPRPMGRSPRCASLGKVSPVRQAHDSSCITASTTRSSTSWSRRSRRFIWAIRLTKRPMRARLSMRSGTLW